MRIVAVANQKGGCGKTTTAINLSSCLAFLGKKVLLVDLDSQGHASVGLGLRPDEMEYTLYDVLSPTVDDRPPLSEVIVRRSNQLHVIPSDLTLSALEQELGGLAGRESRLFHAFEDFDESYDYIFIDCAPGLGILSFNALRMASEILIPVETSLYSLHGLARFIETVRLAEDEFGMQYGFHALVTNYDGRTRMARKFLGEIREYLGDIAFDSVIRRNVRLVDAVTAGKSIVEFDRLCTGFKDYMSCTGELIERASRLVASAAAQTSAEAMVPSERIGQAAEQVMVDAKAALEEHDPAPETAAEAAAPETDLQDPQDASQPSVEVAAEQPEGLAKAQVAEGKAALPVPEAEATSALEGATSSQSDAEDEPTKLEEETEVQKVSLGGSLEEQTRALGEARSGFSLASPDSAGDSPFLELKLKGPVQVTEGVLFAIRDASAQSVMIAGEFNDWRPEPMRLANEETGIWQTIRKLGKGMHRYKFVVNGEWINDPHNQVTMSNPFGSTDSVVNV